MPFYIQHWGFYDLRWLVRVRWWKCIEKNHNILTVLHPLQRLFGVIAWNFFLTLIIVLLLWRVWVYKVIAFSKLLPSIVK